MEQFRGTTIVSVRRNGKVAIAGDGQVSMGNTVMKGNARKVRPLAGGRVIAGFAGGTADAFTLFELFETKLEQYGNLTRAAIELAKDWRTDRRLRRLEALLCVADEESSFIVSGNGDVIEPEHDLMAIGSGGPYAQAAALALLQNTDLDARGIVEKALKIAGDICVYTNQNITVEELAITNVTNDPQRNRPGTGQAHRRPGRRQARRRHRAAQSLAPRAGRRTAAQRDHAQEHPDDRPDRRRQNRNFATPGATGESAVYQSRGDQIHRGRLRRPRG